jgi:ethanolamine permease
VVGTNLSFSCAGGAYGISRVTLGTVAGFVVGCFDAYQSMFNALYSAVAIGGALTMVYGTERRWLPVYWVTVLASYLILHIIGGVWMWRLLKFMTFFSILMIFIYIFGSIQFADFEENAPLWFPFGLEGKYQYFHGGVDLFLQILPFPCWMFAGTESVNLAAHDCENPKRDVPRGYILTWITIFCTSIGCVFIGASVFPGATLIAYYFFPTSVAYAQIFNITIVRATALSIPAIYATGFGFTYYYGSQIRAMGKSGLANPWLGYDVPGFKTPIVALVFGFVVCMLVGLRYYWWKELKGESLLGISLMGASVVYCTQFISYIVLRLYYPTIKREFESPLGILGAVYGLCVFLLVFIVLSGLESQLGIKAFCIYLGAILLYYYLVVRHRQTFSEEEKTVLFKAYLLKSESTTFSDNSVVMWDGCKWIPFVVFAAGNRNKKARLRVGAARSSYRRAASGTLEDESPATITATRYKPTPVSTSVSVTVGSGASRYGGNDDRSSTHSGTIRISGRGRANSEGNAPSSASGEIELLTLAPAAAYVDPPDTGGAYTSTYGSATALSQKDGIDMSLYEAPHTGQADFLQEPNPNVY